MVTKSLLAGEDIPARMLVTLYDEEKVVLADNTTQGIVGVSQNIDIPEGQVVDVTFQGETKVTAGEAITAGSAFSADADGFAVVADAGAKIAGYALEAATSKDEIIRVIMTNSGIVPTTAQE